MNEVTFTKHLLVAFSRVPGVRVWRQNCGKIAIRDHKGDVQRYFDAGPPTGAADISGIHTASGRRIEAEVKMPSGERSAEQLRWAQFIEASRGIYLLVRCDDSLSLAENLAAASSQLVTALQTV